MLNKHFIIALIDEKIFYCRRFYNKCSNAFALNLNLMKSIEWAQT